MKCLIAVIILAAFVITVCTAGILYIDHATDVLSEGLQTCIDYANAEDIAGAKAALKDVQNQWKNKRNMLMMYTDQKILDDVDDQLEYMEALADHHKEEFVPAAVQCMGKLRELKQREVISIYSWF